MCIDDQFDSTFIYVYYITFMCFQYCHVKHLLVTMKIDLMSSFLCSKNVVFGSVIQGFEVVKMIEKIETVGNFHPKVPIQISGCGELIAVIKVSGNELIDITLKQWDDVTNGIQ